MRPSLLHRNKTLRLKEMQNDKKNQNMVASSFVVVFILFAVLLDCGPPGPSLPLIQTQQA